MSSDGDFGLQIVRFTKAGCKSANYWGNNGVMRVIAWQK